MMQLQEVNFFLSYLHFGSIQATPLKPVAVEMRGMDAGNRISAS
jgi:thiamine monophosphate synthase